MLRIAVLMTVRSQRERALRGLEDCIRQMDRLTEDKRYGYDIYLNDDASSDGISEDIRERFPEVRIIPSEGTLSWGGGIRAAWMEAAKSAAYDFYLWLDYAVTLRENALWDLLDTSAFLRHRCILCGSIADPSGRLISGGRTSGGRLLPPDEMIPLPCHTVDGALVLVPKLIYAAIGPLDPLYHHALAAADYGIRARKAGFSCLVCAGISGVSERQLPPSDAKESFHFNRRSHNLPYALWMACKQRFSSHE